VRVVITGWPTTGKTALANQMGGGRSTDEAIPLGWSEASQEVSTWFDEPGPWIIEGMAVPRALRKWKERNPGSPPPIERMIYLQAPLTRLTPEQIAMGKGLDTVLDEIRPWLEASVVIEVR
jgi:hypothetical protein